MVNRLEFSLALRRMTIGLIIASRMILGFYSALLLLDRVYVREKGYESKIYPSRNACNVKNTLSVGRFLIRQGNFKTV